MSAVGESELQDSFIACCLKRSAQILREAFADFCGIHRSHMGEIERGRANVTLLTLLIIAKQLQVTASALLNEIA